MDLLLLPFPYKKLKYKNTENFYPLFAFERLCISITGFNVRPVSNSLLHGYIGEDDSSFHGERKAYCHVEALET